jgi:hypothetical protein
MVVNAAQLASYDQSKQFFVEHGAYTSKYVPKIMVLRASGIHCETLTRNFVYLRCHTQPVVVLFSYYLLAVFRWIQGRDWSAFLRQYD